MSDRRRLIAPALVVLSLAGMAAGYGPLRGTWLALLLTVGGGLALPGWLLARALGRLEGRGLIAAGAWALALGLGATIVAGGLLRALSVPVTVYLGGLHGVMLLLAFIPSPQRVDSAPAQISPTPGGPVYAALLALMCLISLGVSLERNQYRFNGYEDQTVFIALADWLAHDPDDPGIRSRRVGVTVGDVRWDSDGWTYNHAAWVRASGVPAADLIWEGLTPLFAPLVPLAAWAFIAAATGSARAAALGSAALIVAGLLTIDSFVYTNSTLNLGQFGLFQVNTLRAFSRAVMLPLALFALAEHLRTPGRGGAALVALMGFALALLHPYQSMIYAAGGGAAVALWLLADARRRLLPAAALLIALALPLTVPFVQRANLYFDPAAQVTQAEAGLGDEGDAPAVDAAGRGIEAAPEPPAPVEGAPPARPAPAPLPLFLPLNLGGYIINPAVIFYHPIIIAGAALGLLALLRPRGVAAALMAGPTLAMLLLLFTPGLTPLVARFTQLQALPALVFLPPLGLIFGAWLERIAARGRWAGPGLAAALALIALALLTEPFPIPGSARDQIRASNMMQAGRDRTPVDAALAAALADLLPADRRSVVLSPNVGANFILEAAPKAFITGGREGTGNAESYAGTARFFTEREPVAPWLDEADRAFLARYGVTHIAIRASDTRLPALLLDPGFAPLGTVAGYHLLAVADAEESAADALYGRMNALYRGGRPGPGGIAPAGAADYPAWDALIAEWEALPVDASARLGLAYAVYMRGDFARAAALWADLTADHPELPPYALFAEWARADLGPLRAALAGGDATAAAVAARVLLTADHFYRLEDDDRGRVAALVASESRVWDALTAEDGPTERRRRAALLLHAGAWAAAEAELGRIDPAARAPDDLATGAALRLLADDPAGALDAVRPALNFDTFAANWRVHPDRWPDQNRAAALYHLLRGALAAEAGDDDGARAAYRAAIDAGAYIAGRVFLADLSADPAAADRLRAEAEARWVADHDTALPDLVPLTRLRGADALYALDPALSVEEPRALWATLGDLRPHGRPFAVRDWRVEIITPAGDLLAGWTVPAQFVEGALVRVPLALDVPADLPELTPALIYLTAQHDRAQVAGSVRVNAVLNRPPGVDLPAEAVASGAQFGAAVTLAAYTVEQGADALTVTLHWRADGPVGVDYQAFVHVLDAAGAVAAQADGAPVDGRYPTSHWRPGDLSAAVHRVDVAGLPPGDYALTVGLYTLPDGARPAAPASLGVVVK